MANYLGPLIDEWPTISFKEFEGIEIENSIARTFYNSFFSMLHIPEIIVHSFIDVFKEGHNV